MDHALTMFTSVTFPGNEPESTIRNDVVISNFTHIWTFTPICRKLSPFDDHAQTQALQKG